MLNKYLIVTGLLFGVIALLHTLRLWYQWPVQVGGVDIPLWLSWIGMGVTAALSACAWRLGCAKGS